MALSELVERNARKYPEKVAVIFAENRFTFTQFADRVHRLANGLMKLGMLKGDRVAMLAQNCHQYMEAYFAVAQAGLVLVPINYRLTGREVFYILNHSEANALIYQEEYRDLVLSIARGLTSVKQFICLDREYEELLAAVSPRVPIVQVSEDDLVCIMYTSGTTGQPKGAAMTGKNWLAHTVNMILELAVAHEDVTLHIVPFFHIASIWPMLTHFYVGGTNVIIKAFEPELVLEIFEKEKITTCNAVPTMIIQLLECPDAGRYDYSSLKWLGYGASPMPLEVLKRAMKLFGPKLLQVYGLTEANPLLTILPVREHILDGPEEIVKRLSSCGREIINVHVRVVDEQGKDVVSGQVGEIIARGDNIIKEYWRNPEETAATIRDGWLYTGDLASVDEAGYIYIVDRKKDVIISGGENISSREVEEVVYTHPAVLEAAVIGVPDEKWGEAVKAIIVLRPGKQASEGEILDICRKNLAPYKRPKSIEFVDSLPKSGAGKILKRELREKYWKGYDRRVH